MNYNKNLIKKIICQFIFIRIYKKCIKYVTYIKNEKEIKVFLSLM
jgi:hypothetical protein